MKYVVDLKNLKEFNKEDYAREILNKTTTKFSRCKTLVDDNNLTFTIITDDFNTQNCNLEDILGFIMKYYINIECRTTFDFDMLKYDIKVFYALSKYKHIEQINSCNINNTKLYLEDKEIHDLFVEGLKRNAFPKKFIDKARTMLTIPLFKLQQ